jgi:hypothetical protein
MTSGPALLPFIARLDARRRDRTGTHLKLSHPAPTSLPMATPWDDLADLRPVGNWPSQEFKAPSVTE